MDRFGEDSGVAQGIQIDEVPFIKALTIRGDKLQQLVIQFPLSTIEPNTAELEALAEIEQRLECLSDANFEVDGHDAGAGEMNIFILAADATKALDSIRPHLPGNQSWRAGFRDLGEDHYSPLAPAGLAIFQVK